MEPENTTPGFAGIDECGMGPIAGPVTAAAVVIRAHVVPGVRDSKKVSEEERYRLADLITAQALLVHVTSRSNEDIDERRLDVCWAECVAECRDAVLARFPDIEVLADWAPGAKAHQEQLAGIQFIRDGEDQVYAIAAASLVAKAHRDRYMIELDRQFPAYGLAQHKGYGTDQHWAALRTHGPSPIHRAAAAKPKAPKVEAEAFDPSRARSLLAQVNEHLRAPWLGDWERKFLGDAAARVNNGYELSPRQMYFLVRTVGQVRHEARNRRRDE